MLQDSRIRWKAMSILSTHSTPNQKILHSQCLARFTEPFLRMQSLRSWMWTTTSRVSKPSNKEWYSLYCRARKIYTGYRNLWYLCKATFLIDEYIQIYSAAISIGWFNSVSYGRCRYGKISNHKYYSWIYL